MTAAIGAFRTLVRRFGGSSVRTDGMVTVLDVVQERPQG